MTTTQKSLLTLALTGLVIGITVSLMHAQPAPLWTLALPAGVVFLGWFLLALVWQREMGRVDEAESVKRQ